MSRLVLVVGAIASAALAAFGWALAHHDPGERE